MRRNRRRGGHGRGGGCVIRHAGEVVVSSGPAVAMGREVVDVCFASTVCQELWQVLNVRWEMTATGPCPHPAHRYGRQDGVRA